MSKQHQESTCETVKLKSLLETNNHVLEEVVSLRANIEQLHHQIHEREQMLSKQSEVNEHQQQTMLSKFNLLSVNGDF